MRQEAFAVTLMSASGGRVPRAAISQTDGVIVADPPTSASSPLVSVSGIAGPPLTAVPARLALILYARSMPAGQQLTLPTAAAALRDEADGATRAESRPLA